MNFHARRPGAACLALLAVPACGLWIGFQPVAAAAPPRATEGSLTKLDSQGRPAGACPLKNTDVKAEITGFVARVTVTQNFENPFQETIEAVYTFPLPQNAAVDDMTIRVGDRTVKGRIKRREEARAMYDAARARGHVAALLDQERPNIFTQSVAHIMPGETVQVVIRYVEFLPYKAGSYEFHFPMVVGPRYIPGQPVSGPNPGGGWAIDTTKVPDASRMTPRVTPPGTRAGHDIRIEVTIDAGVPIKGLVAPSHEVVTERPGAAQAVVRLKNQNTIPNRDFVLRYDVAGSRISDALLAHRGQRGGFFTLILQPPERASLEDITPKELVFVLDTSGSMSGFPIEKAKEAMKLALDGLNPRDTFNLITFAGDTRVLFPRPVPASPENLRSAQAFLAGQQGGGGTEMMKAIRAALENIEPHRVRIVCFMTDGYVGNDLEIIAEVQKHPNARVFSFGIGSAVNRFLLDQMAEHGRGEVEYVALNSDGSAAAKRFHERIRNPLLTDITIEWNGLPVADVYPARIPDLFDARPVVIQGRYTAPAKGTLRLKGTYAGRVISRDIAVDLPAAEPRHDVLATLWARARIAALMARDFAGIQSGRPQPDVREAITQVGLEYRLMTQFTSFVAVEEVVVSRDGQVRRVEVPVEMPEGVSYEGVFGDADRAGSAAMAAPPAWMLLRSHSRGVVGGVIGGGPRPLAPPPVAEAATRFEPERTAGGPYGKLDVTLRAVLEATLAGQPVPAAKAVVNGKAEVQIWLSDARPEVLVKLKQLGFEVLVQPRAAKTVIGRIAVRQLAELVKVAAVRFVSPAAP